MLNLPFAISLLAAGTLFYAFAEVLRHEGRSVLLVSDLTLIASRDKDMGTFVLGPVTLGIGTMLALMLYPRPAASIAIYALAFGDGFASLVGKTIGGLKIPFLRGKTFSGTTACFAAVFLVTLKITARPLESLAIGLIAALLEAAPLGDYDNIVIPVGVGLAATQLLYS
jgi:dolichol kinase